MAIQSNAPPLVSLGIVPVTTAGTPVQVSAVSFPVRRVFFTAIKAKGTANTGANIYVQDINKNVLAVIPKTAAAPIALPFSDDLGPASIDLTNLYLDADTSADGCLVTAQK